MAVADRPVRSTGSAISGYCSRMASGLSIGLAIGLGGVAALVLGALADTVDLRAALLATALGPAIAFGVSFLLPPAPGRRSFGPEPAPATL